MEGVIVSARASRETWTTSVYTDQQGNYSFPSLSPDQYSMWAQFKGYDLAKVADLNLADSSRLTHDLTLRPLADQRVIANQLAGPDWFAALPESNDQDRRMKHLLRNNCSFCHPVSFTLSHRFDARGWAILIDMMPQWTFWPNLNYRNPDEPKTPMWQAYKEEFAEYLGRVTPDLQPRPLPQTRGAATGAVIIEYDVPRQGRPPAVHNGTYWTEGQPTDWESKGARDIWIDDKGIVWTSDDQSMGRTLGRLDPRTGKWTDYAMPDDKGVAFATHGVTGDPKTGLVYQGTLPPGDPSILIFDPKTEEFVSYLRPKSIPIGGAFLSVDSQSNVWATAFGPGGGVQKLDPKTGTYTFYPVPYPDDVPEFNQNQYGMVVDSLDNVWVARPGAETVGYLEPKTGKTGNVRFERLVMPGLTEKDRTVSASMTTGPTTGPPNGRGPRRLASGGNYVYVALMKSDEVAQIDIRTKQVKTFPLPKGSAAYAVRVDKNGNVWVAANNADSFYKLDPRTGQVTDFQLPTRGTDLRDVTVDNTTSPPTVWGAYSRSNKIVRLQERPAGTQQAAAK